MYEWNEKIPPSTKYLYTTILNLLKDKNKLILDVGCGNGHLANKLISEGFNVYGVDSSGHGIFIANKQKQNDEKFFVCDITQDELPDKIKNFNFDTVISTEVLEHIYDSDKFLQFCKKALINKNGELIISVPYHGYIKNIFIALFGKSDFHFDSLRTGGHIKFWSKKTIQKVLERNGFEIIYFKGCGRMPYLWKSMIIKAKITGEK